MYAVFLHVHTHGGPRFSLIQRNCVLMVVLLRTLSILKKKEKKKPHTEQETERIIALCIFKKNLDVPVVEFMYLVFTRMPGESYRR